MFDLLPANLLEHKEVARLDGSYRNYQQITASVLLMFGGRSRLKWVDQSIEALSEILPSSDKKELSEPRPFWTLTNEVGRVKSDASPCNFSRVNPTTRPRLRPTAYWHLAQSGCLP